MILSLIPSGFIRSSSTSSQNLSNLYAGLHSRNPRHGPSFFDRDRTFLHNRPADSIVSSHFRIVGKTARASCRPFNWNISRLIFIQGSHLHGQTGSYGTRPNDSQGNFMPVISIRRRYRRDASVSKISQATFARGYST